ncbi:MAG: hypothetical protein NTV86_16720, partial [Planctomycetota bacterium]|nr:hypothetical protein [Planctomycetota bacterium]
MSSGSQGLRGLVRPRRRRSVADAPVAVMEQLEPRTLLTIIANPALQLTVDYPTGAATLTNTSASALLMDLYQIKSAAGNLDPAT